MTRKKIFFCLIAISSSAFAFDLEDYATTYRATRDAYLKAANEMKLATGPYKSARNAYKNAAQQYIKELGSGNPAMDQSVLAKRRTTCVGQLFTEKPEDLVGGEAPAVVNEINSRAEYLNALKSVESSGKEYSASLKAYVKATNEYVHSLSLPVDYTLIKRTQIQNAK